MSHSTTARVQQHRQTLQRVLLQGLTVRSVRNTRQQRRTRAEGGSNASTRAFPPISLGPHLLAFGARRLLLRPRPPLPCCLSCFGRSRMALALPRAEARSLLVGLPDRGAALARQLANLVEFEEDNAEEFAAMPYEPWTRAPPHDGAFRGLRFEVRASTVRGLRGVFPLQTVPSKEEGQRLLYYPGLLVTQTLFNKFYRDYYCPTGLNLPALGYKDEKGHYVGMTIIGDPTSLGALINDGRYGRSDGEGHRHKLLTQTQMCVLHALTLIFLL